MFIRVDYRVLDELRPYLKAAYGDAVGRVGGIALAETTPTDHR